MAQPIQSFSKAQTGIVDNGNIGGLAKNVFLIRASAVASIPAPTANTNTVPTAITFVDDETEVFAAIYHTKNTGEVRFAQQGEFDHRSFKNMIEFRIPSNHDTLLRIARDLCNEDLIAVGKDKLGNYRIIGTLDNPASMSEITGSSGKAPTDPRHVTFIIESDEINPPFILTVAPQFEVTVP